MFPQDFHERQQHQQQQQKPKKKKKQFPWGSFDLSIRHPKKKKSKMVAALTRRLNPAFFFFSLLPSNRWNRIEILFFFGSFLLAAGPRDEIEGNLPKGGAVLSEFFFLDFFFGVGLHWPSTEKKKSLLCAAAKKKRRHQQFNSEATGLSWTSKSIPRRRRSSSKRKCVRRWERGRWQEAPFVFGFENKKNKRQN